MTNLSIEIGAFEGAEADLLGVISYEAVREGAADFYSVKQRRAWMPNIPSGPKWASRLSSQTTVVARKDGIPVGFMTLDDNGYIDLAFVSPKHQKQGIGGLLYTRIEALAHSLQLARLHSHASYMVRGLFEQHAWEVVREQQIERSGVTLTNFLMEKRLSGA